MVGAGASGAIFGLIGAALMLSRRGSGRLASHIRGYVVQWAIYGLVMGFVLHADNVAHIGGLVSGALFARFVNPDRVPRRGWLAIEGACLAVVIVCFLRAAQS
jgi:rhomboid protease GluP